MCSSSIRWMSSNRHCERRSELLVATLSRPPLIDLYYMKSQRIVRVNELIRREIAANMPQFAHGLDINLAAVTITRVSVASNLRTARVWVSVLDGADAVSGATPDVTDTTPSSDPGKEESSGNAGRVLAMLLDRRREIQAHLARTLKIKYTPRLFFEFDDSLAQGDRVLSLLNRLEETEDTEDTDPPEGTGYA